MSVVTGNKQQTDNASGYLSPKDYGKPVYPSPAQQLAEMTLREKQIEEQTEPPAPPIPPELHKQMKSLTLYPPLPSSDSGDGEMPVTKKI